MSLIFSESISMMKASRPELDAGAPQVGEHPSHPTTVSLTRMPHPPFFF